MKFVIYNLNLKLYFLSLYSVLPLPPCDPPSRHSRGTRSVTDYNNIYFAYNLKPTPTIAAINFTLSLPLVRGINRSRRLRHRHSPTRINQSHTPFGHLNRNTLFQKRVSNNLAHSPSSALRPPPLCS